MNRGFTVLELLVVLLVMALFVGFGYSGFREFSNRQLLTNQQRELISDLRFSQSQALAGRKPVGCTDTLVGYGVRLETVAGVTNYVIEASCGSLIEVKRVPVNPKVTFSTDFGNPVAIPNLLFYPVNGGTNIALGATKTITLTVCQPRPIPPYNCLDLSVTVEITSTGSIKG